jgi:hypothetical protein
MLSGGYWWYLKLTLGFKMLIDCNVTTWYADDKVLVNMLF